MSRAFDSKELREMLDSHKDWPVVFLVDSDVVGEDYWNWYAGGYSCKEGEVLDCKFEKDEEGNTYTDREDLRDAAEYYVYRTAENVPSDEELDAEVERICKQYEPCWKKAVIVYVTT